jgi:hypothetical protein
MSKPHYTRDDRDDRYTGKTDDIAPEILARVRQQNLGAVASLPAWAVDGKPVRMPNGIGDIDFTQGGNGARYRYIPAELWIEDSYLRHDLGEGACTLVHEAHEFYAMRDDGLDYAHAHDSANEVEGALREALCSGEVECPATPDEAVALANDWLRKTGLGE